MRQETFVRHDRLNIEAPAWKAAQKAITDFAWLKEPFLDHVHDLYGTKGLYYTFFLSDSVKSDYDNARSMPAKRVLSRVHPLLLAVRSRFPRTRPLKAEVAHLPPGVVQRPQIDPRVFHHHARRVHLAIITNEQCHLEVSDERFHIAEGEIISFNNLKLHRSINDGTTARTHLIVDLIDNSLYDDLVGRYGLEHLYKRV